MQPFRRILATVLVPLAILCSAPTHAQQDSRTDTQYVWDLTDLYPSVDAWHVAREDVLKEISALEQFKGTLGKSPDKLYSGLFGISATLKSVSRLYVYAGLLHDEDIGNTANQEINQLAEIAYAQFGEATAWLEPELLTLGERKIQKFLKKNEKLEPFRHYLNNTLRNAPHTLDTEGEKTLSLFTRSLEAPSNIYSVLSNSDIPWPQVRLSDGKEYRIDAAGYSRWRASQNRSDRQAVFDAYWGKWKDYRSTIGNVLNSHLQAQVALARSRKYDSVLQRELFEDNLPEEIYRTLVREVNQALPTLHRYFKLRGEMLGVKQMKYYDIYPTLVSLDKEFDIETSIDITLKAMQPLGDDWRKKQSDAMRQRWMHVFPSPGKRSGAYMSGSAYDVHPYVLLNHNDDYESLSTLAHEWGHVVHTLYATESQPFETFRYSTFIAEIPSTSLELILQEYMVENATTVDEKLFYLGSGLESLRATFFRQTMFAEFELLLYEAVEKGEALSGEKISQMYGEILRRYHGHDQKVVEIDELYHSEWMFIPHFYYNMYVFQYATSITAGTALYERMVTEGDNAVERFINLLRAGGSDYPHTLLKQAGVDLTQPEPFRAVVKRMNLIMDEMEKLLEQKQSR